ncbi:hypothetical protein M514_05885 [Trichuris suis]|uniref:Uncharacterized protein n=1 Tax=Trichuris suis TaxID=68888 RepID=A0A085MU24_9BILA|nr:hypothetical protein M514_05885 [Trichuris suis]KHJ48455.1 hypothetical protein D918_00757 [Trichuris suis]
MQMPEEMLDNANTEAVEEKGGTNSLPVAHEDMKYDDVPSTGDGGRMDSEKRQGALVDKESILKEAERWKKLFKHDIAKHHADIEELNEKYSLELSNFGKELHEQLIGTFFRSLELLHAMHVDETTTEVERLCLRHERELEEIKKTQWVLIMQKSIVDNLHISLGQF